MYPIKNKTYDFTLKYKKFFTRDMPIVDVETWYYGERSELPRMIENATFFNPLFKYTPGKGVSVYYDMNNDDTLDTPILDYYKKNPEKAKELITKTESLVEQIIVLTKDPQISDFKKLFELSVSFFSILVVLMLLGDANKYPSKFNDAFLLTRKKYENLIYDAQAALTKIGKEIIGKRSIDYKFVKFEELQGNKFDLKEIESRKKGYFFYNNIIFANMDQKIFEKKNNLGFLDEEVKDTNIIKGNIASKGFVKGRVKIVTDLSELDKVNKGDILVTPMTTPEFVVAMGKCAAIVTNEGGLTCHAAIVARELGKPCIIGTKNATEILKDNDLVEVDANKGIIKRID